MINLIKTLIFFLLAFAGALPIALGQTEAGMETPVQDIQMRLTGRSYGDSIVLRWAVPTSDAWRYLNEQGYVLERLTLDDKTNQPVSQDFERLTPEPIRPWPIEAWQARITNRDTFAAIAAQSLFGTYEQEVNDDNLIEVLDNKIQEEENRFSFAMLSADLSMLAADALGLRFVDRNVQMDKKYIYRLWTPGVDPAFKADTAIFVQATRHIRQLEAPEAPTFVPGDSVVILNWKRTTGITAYHIERSADDGATWTRLTQMPYMQFFRNKETDPDNIGYNDFIGHNFVPYLYRIRGCTSFGEVTPPSEPIEVMGFDLTPTAAPTITFAENTSGSQVELRWTIPDVPDLGGFLVVRSVYAEGPYDPLHEQLLPTDARSFVDENAYPYGSNFYRVYSVDDHGNLATSHFAYVLMKDEIPPAPPIGLTGVVDTNGVVTVSWNIGKEPDLHGYQVFAANQIDHTFIPITERVLEDSVFTDTIDLKNLTEHIYYRVKAVDRNMNVSEFSEILELKKPDFMPPVAPVFLDYSVTDTSIVLSWASSSSHDASGTLLYRRSEGEEWELIGQWPVLITEFTDTEVRGNQIYEYALVATDDDGNHSEKSFPLTLKVYDSGRRAPLTTLQAVWKEKENAVELSWNYETSEQIRFLIFRAAPGEPLRFYKAVPGTQLTWTDKGVAQGQDYRYAVKALHDGGGESEMSEVRVQ
jgi:uncharacterized protein